MDGLLASQDNVDMIEQEVPRDKTDLEERVLEMVKLEQEKFLQQMQELQVQFAERVQQQMLAVIKQTKD